MGPTTTGPWAPQRSSDWPVRILGNLRWFESVARGWNHRTWRSPEDAYRTLRDDFHTSAWLYALIRHARPLLAVETGVHRGKSSVAILAGLRANGRGHLVSIDLPHDAPYLNDDGKVEGCCVADGDTGHLIPRSWRDRWTLRLGDARDLLPGIVAGGLDFFLHDSLHSTAQMRFEYETAWRALRIGGILATDDVDWSDAWDAFLASHSGWRSLPDGPNYHRAVRKVA